MPNRDIEQKGLNSPRPAGEPTVAVVAAAGSAPSIFDQINALTQEAAQAAQLRTELAQLKADREREQAELQALRERTAADEKQIVKLLEQIKHLKNAALIFLPLVERLNKTVAGTNETTTAKMNRAFEVIGINRPPR